MRKTITSSLVAGQQFFGLDNLQDTKTFRSATYAAAVTTSVWSDRLLTVSQNIEGTLRWSWILTGNNPVVDLDIARRIVRTRLKSRVDRPHLRTDFKIKRLRQWVVAHHAELLTAALTLVQAWVRAGMPKGKQVLGSFEAWAEVIGGILEHVGVPEFLAVVDDPVGTTRDEFQQVIEFWLETYGSKKVTSAEVYNAASAVDVPAYGDDDTSCRKAFGNRLRKKRETVFSVRGHSVELVLCDPAPSGANRWALRSTTGETITPAQHDKNDKNDRTSQHVLFTEDRNEMSPQTSTPVDPVNPVEGSTFGSGMLGGEP